MYFSEVKQVETKYDLIIDSYLNQIYQNINEKIELIYCNLPFITQNFKEKLFQCICQGETFIDLLFQVIQNFQNGTEEQKNQIAKFILNLQNPLQDQSLFLKEIFSYFGNKLIETPRKQIEKIFINQAIKIGGQTFFNTFTALCQIKDEEYNKKNRESIIIFTSEEEEEEEETYNKETYNKLFLLLKKLGNTQDQLQKNKRYLLALIANHLKSAPEQQQILIIKNLLKIDNFFLKDLFLHFTKIDEIMRIQHVFSSVISQKYDKLLLNKDIRILSKLFLHLDFLTIKQAKTILEQLSQKEDKDLIDLIRFFCLKNNIKRGNIFAKAWKSSPESFNVLINKVVNIFNGSTDILSNVN